MRAGIRRRNEVLLDVIAKRADVAKRQLRIEIAHDALELVAPAARSRAARACATWISPVGDGRSRYEK